MSVSSDGLRHMETTCSFLVLSAGSFGRRISRLRRKYSRLSSTRSNMYTLFAPAATRTPRENGIMHLISALVSWSAAALMSKLLSTRPSRSSAECWLFTDLRGQTTMKVNGEWRSITLARFSNRVWSREGFLRFEWRTACLDPSRPTIDRPRSNNDTWSCNFPVSSSERVSTLIQRNGTFWRDHCQLHRFGCCLGDWRKPEGERWFHDEVKKKNLDLIDGGMRLWSCGWFDIDVGHHFALLPWPIDQSVLRTPSLCE